MIPPSRIKLYLDEMIPVALAEVLNQYGHDAITAKQANMLGKDDNEQLEFASSRGRVILTFNIKDFTKLHKEWLASGKSHSGIIVSSEIRMTQFRYLLNLCLKMLKSATSKEMVNYIFSKNFSKDHRILFMN